MRSALTDDRPDPGCGGERQGGMRSPGLRLSHRPEGYAAEEAPEDGDGSSKGKSKSLQRASSRRPSVATTVGSDAMPKTSDEAQPRPCSGASNGYPARAKARMRYPVQPASPRRSKMRPLSKDPETSSSTPSDGGRASPLGAQGAWQVCRGGRRRQGGLHERSACRSHPMLHCARHWTKYAVVALSSIYDRRLTSLDELSVLSNLRDRTCRR
jgi:hypothetical protein